MERSPHDSPEQTYLTALFRIVVENVPDFSIFLVNPRNRVISWNHAATRMFGYTEEEMLGKDTAVLFTPEDRAKGAPFDELERAARDGKAADERWHLRKDGSRFYVSGTVIPVRRNGEIEAFAKLGRDLTDRVEQQETLRRANESKDEFLAIVSHELRTPLTATLGWAQLARAVPLNSETLGTALEAIERTSRLQAQLVDDLMDGAAIMAGKLRLEMRPQLVSKCVDAALATVKSLIDERGLDLKTEIDESVTVLADSNRLQQIIWNMLTNAIKFTPKDGWLRVEVTADHDAVIRVTDSGEGISAEFLPFVFDRFRQGEPPGKRAKKGLGLGLAIVKHLVEAQGGSVRAASPGVGHGAEFEVRLPIITADEMLNGQLVDLTGGASDMEKAAQVPSIKGVRVLLVEDDAETRMMLSQVLDGYGAKVAAVSSAAAGRREFERKPPDVIISDIALADEDGFDFIASIRKREGDRDRTPAIALTAFTRSDDRVRVLSSGFQLYLPKPVDMAELKAAIVSVTNRS